MPEFVVIFTYHGLQYHYAESTGLKSRKQMAEINLVGLCFILIRHLHRRYISLQLNSVLRIYFLLPGLFPLHYFINKYYEWKIPGKRDIAVFGSSYYATEHRSIHIRFLNHLLVP